MMRGLLYQISRTPYHLWTLFLFTKSDIKSIVAPVTILACSSAPISKLSHLPHVIFWIWFHVLQFAVSNQILKPEEDELNKRDRPVPSKRITLEDAHILRWVLVPLCWILSAFYSVETVYASVALCILTWIYDEAGFSDSHWVGRNLLNALGYAAFEVGACLIAGSNRHVLDNVGAKSVLISIGLLLSTIQAQDFKDINGDRKIGRKTLPIVAPNTARHALMAALIIWSIGLSALWGLSAAAASGLNALALTIGLRFVSLRSVISDQRSFVLYNVWLTLAHTLPAYFRLLVRAPVSV